MPNMETSKSSLNECGKLDLISATCVSPSLERSEGECIGTFSFTVRIRLPTELYTATGGYQKAFQSLLWSGQREMLSVMQQKLQVMSQRTSAADLVHLFHMENRVQPLP